MSPLTIIRSVRPTDDASLSRICLLTGAAGSSAEAAHSHPELLGLIFALPYNRLETTFGFVLVDVDDNGDENIVGYILGTTDSKKYEAVAERDWWPMLRSQYPQGADYLNSRTSADSHLISVIHKPYITPQDIIARFPAHIHIDILPSHQRKSYGRKLMSAAVNHLLSQNHKGLFVGLDPANEPAKVFYSRLGFKRIEKEGGEWWGLKFENFKGELYSNTLSIVP